MAEKEQYEVEFEYTSAGSSRVASDLDRLLDKVDDLARKDQITEKAQDQLSRAILRTGDSAAKAAKQVSSNADALAKASQKMQSALANERGGRNYSNLSVNYDAGIEARQREAKAWSAVLQARMKDEVAAERQAAANNKLNSSLERQAGSLPTLRYALYDVSSTFAVAGTALAGFTALSFKAAIDYERAFANVIRTNDALMSSQVAAERAFQDFVDLAGELPMSFQNLTEIGTLAGQLGVATSRMEDFTRTTAQFSTVTGESIDTTATAFGRLDALLPDVQGNYDALGSSILNVGINSVATEGEVIKITTQLAGVGRQAGLTSAEVVGLSGALASVGVQPELARGTITRLFGQISRAVATGGENLQGFAQIAGTTGDEFAAKWGSAPMEAVLDVFRGIQSRGSEAESALRAVGITSVRDVPAILRLSQTMDSVLVPALQDAKAGFEDGTQLADNYGVISETTAAKLQILANNFQSLLAALGDSATVFGGLLDAANAFLTWLRELQKNPATAFFSQLAVVVVGLGGILLLLAAALTRGAAGMIAFRTAMAEAGVQSTGLRANLTALIGTMSGVDAAAAKSTGSMSRLSGVMRTVGVLGLATAVIPLSQWLDGVSASARGAVVDTDTLTQSLSQLDAEISALQAKDVSSVLQKSIGSVGNASPSDGGATQIAQMVRPGGALWNDLVLGIRGMMTDAETEYILGIQRLGSRNIATPVLEWLPESVASAIDPSVAEINRLEEAFIQAWENAATETQRQALLDEFERLRGNVDAAGGSVENFNQNFASFIEVTAQGTDQTLLMAEAAQAEADALESLQGEMLQIVDDVYSTINAQYDLQKALFDVGEAFVSQGAAVAFTGDTMQNAIRTIIEQSGSAGSAAANLQVLFDYLVKGGYASAAQLTHLQQVIAGLMRTAGGKTVAPTLQMPNFKAFEQGMSRGLSRGVGGAAKKAAKAVREVRQEVRTLVDYANDLESTWKRAFDIRFSVQSTLDPITKAFMDMRNEITEAQKAMRDLRNDIQGLQSDISIQEYYLSIAIEYGDTQRANALEAELAKKRAELADKTQQLQEEQAKVNKTLVGSSAAAIENRAAILNLVKQYQDHLKALAATGATSGNLEAASNRLRAEFMAQARALGFNETELQSYSAAFTDMATIIRSTPVGITTDLSGLDPALIAIREFADKANAALSNVGSGLEGGSGGGGGGGIGGFAETALEAAEPMFTKAGFTYDEKLRKAFIDATILNLPRDVATTMYDSLISGEMSVDEAAKQMGLSGEQEFVRKYGEYLPNDLRRTVSGGFVLATPSATQGGASAGSAGAQGTNSAYSNNLNLAGPIQSKASLAQGTARSNGATLGSIIADGLRSGISWALDLSLGSGTKARKLVRSVTGFAGGGYTGSGGMYEPAGIVHRGEYVIPKRDVNQATGMPYADALGRLMTGVRGYATGGYVRPSASATQTPSVSLSAGTIQALAQAVQQYIVVDGQVLGKTTSKAYAESNSVGAY